MPADRTITFPAAAASSVRDRLMDEFPHLPHETAQDLAIEIAIEITEGVDKLRAIEAREPGHPLRDLLYDGDSDDMPRWMGHLPWDVRQVYERYVLAAREGR